MGNGNRELDRIIYESENALQWFSNPNAPIINPPISFKEFTTSNEDVGTLANYFLWYYEHPAVTIQPNRSEQAIAWFNFLGGEVCPVVVPRLNSDGMLNNPYWYSLNPFYQSGYGLPNCTCYAWGRRYEITGKAPDTSLRSADTWFDYAVSHGQKTGQTPKAGSIMVWKYTGSHANDGGHVAIVEEIDGETVVTSNSAYGGTYFYTQTLSPPYEWASYTQFQGFIYLDCSIVPPKPSDKKVNCQFGHIADYYKKGVIYMAILTKTGMNKILRRIMETGGLTPDMEEDIQRLRDDFDERESILKKYGETYDGEDADEYEYTGRDTDDIYTPKEEEKDAKEWRTKYEEMKARYLDRFFGGVNNDENFEETMNETREDVERDGEPQTFDELLERVEG